ncbi:MAG: FecR family protein [Bdellovibrionaceae bacterium]|nr:FecR family protein [Pseudobdellovibrionaceae bacterium]NUM58292.1 FecR domain-containing protein [Pseudobdellovibrionaceae bacterium]
MAMVKFNKTDRVILSVAIIILIVYSYFLYDDTFLFSIDSSNEKQIGSLSMSSNDVRKKTLESFQWIPAKSNQSLNEKDSIFTGEKSSAVIKLNDGSLIKLGENSLISLTTRSGNVELNLKYGEIQTEIKASTKVQLKTEGENLVLENNKKNISKVKIKKSKLSSAKLDLLEGSVSLSSKTSNQKLALKKNETLDVASTKLSFPPALTQLQGKIDLITPEQMKIVLINPKQGFFLNWSGKNTTNEKLVIAKDKEFQNEILTKTNIPPKIFINELSDGIFYWKVVGKDVKNSDITSSIQTFDIKTLKKPEIVSPLNNSSIQLLTKTDVKTHKGEVVYNWESDFALFEYQLSNDDIFNKIIDTKKITEKKLSLALPQGQYYFKIRGLYNNQYSEWSTVNKINILTTKIKELPPLAPTLITKNLSSTIKISPRQPSSISPVLIRWNKVNKASKYIVELSQDSQFTKTQNYETTNNALSFTPTDTPLYFIRVKAQSPEGLQSNYSDVGNIKTELPNPILELNESLIVKSGGIGEKAPSVKFELNWNQLPFVNTYFVEQSTTSDFKNVTSTKTGQNKSTIEVNKPGIFHFRVIASIDSTSLKANLISNIKTATYDFKQKLKSPDLLEPRNKLTVFLQKDVEPFIWTNWEKEKLAVNYSIQISDSPDFSKPLLEKTMTDNKFLLKEKLPLGNIYWRVKANAKDPAMSSSWSKPSEFILNHNKNNEAFQ